MQGRMQAVMGQMSSHKKQTKGLIDYSDLLSLKQFSRGYEENK